MTSVSAARLVQETKPAAVRPLISMRKCCAVKGSFRAGGGMATSVAGEYDAGCGYIARGGGIHEKDTHHRGGRWCRVPGNWGPGSDRDDERTGRADFSVGLGLGRRFRRQANHRPRRRRAGREVLLAARSRRAV